MKVSEISLFWKRYLWPERISQIEPVSCINSNGEIDLSLLWKYKPQFYGLSYDSEIYGVVSSCQADFNEVRLRGVCIRPDMCGFGYWSKLIQKVLNTIDIENTNVL